MIEKQLDGSYKAVWFSIPGGRCFYGGMPSVNGRCIHCEYKTEDHQKIESTQDKK